MTGKTAIITGGGRGIGRAVAIALSKQGINVVINYSSSEGAALETVKLCCENSVKAIAIKGNVSVLSECEAICSKAISEFGSIDILINNAGITKDNLIIKMSDEDFDSVISTNLKGSFNMMKAVSRIMMKQRSGRIINISSVVGLIGNAGQVNYSASKAGVIGMTKSLARELAGRNITVNAIAPGFIKTDMTASLPETISQKILETIPLSRFGDPEDVANAAVFLSSDGGKYITGQVLSIDGGMSMC